jgi:hypothetical protein
MRSREQVEAVLTMGRGGACVADIARATGVPRSTARGWLAGVVPASARPAARSCSRCGAPAHDVSDVAREYLYLLGIYLGDGCISAHPRDVFRLRITLDARYPLIIEECCAAIGAVAPGRRIGRVSRTGGFPNSAPGSNIEVGAYSKTWPCLFPQHGAGRKHERRIELAPWQTALVDEHPDQILRGLIHSDGCRFINTGRRWRYPRYSFSNRSEDIRGIFSYACDRFGVRWTLAPHTVYVSRIEDVARLDEVIGPKA